MQKRLPPNQAMAISRERFRHKCLLNGIINSLTLGDVLGKKDDITGIKLNYYEINLINHN